MTTILSCSPAYQQHHKVAPPRPPAPSQEQEEAYFELHGFSIDESTGNLLILGHKVSELVKEFGSPLVVYNESLIRSQYRILADSFSTATDGSKIKTKLSVHYAMKANFNPTVLRILEQEGASIDAVSPIECELAMKMGFAANRILFTGNNIGVEDLRYCLQKGIQVNIESLATLDSYGEMLDQIPDKPEHLEARPVSIRINPDVGAAHHSHCITGGPSSKFGIYPHQIGEVFEIIAKHNLTLVGLHAHIGSGILDPEPMEQALEIVLGIARRLVVEGKREEGKIRALAPNAKRNKLVELQWIDVGGGFGVPYSPEEKTLDVPTLAHRMAEKFAKFSEELGITENTRPLELRIEPGRFLVASAATLLTTVTNVKSNPCYKFVGVDTGMNHLVRPMLYGAYHHIIHAETVKADKKKYPVDFEGGYVIVGNICETGDVLTGKVEGDLGDIHHGEAAWNPRWLPKIKIGHHLAICDVGAYGIAMSSQYNLRARPAEVLLRPDGKKVLIRKRETLEDMIGTCVDPTVALS